MAYGMFLIYSVAIHMGWGVTVKVARAFLLDGSFRERIAAKITDARLRDSVLHLETTLPEQTRKAVIRQFDILLASAPARISFGLSSAMTRQLLPTRDAPLVTLGNFGATPQRTPALAKAMATNRLIDVLTEANVRRDARPEMLLLEEVGVLVKQQAVAEYLLEASRTLRWKGLSIVCVAQDPANAIPKETYTALVLNSKWLLSFECGREEALWLLPHMARAGKSDAEDRRMFVAEMAKLPTQEAVFVRKGLPGFRLRMRDIADPARGDDRAALLDTFTSRIAARSMVRIADAEERIARFEAVLFGARETPAAHRAPRTHLTSLRRQSAISLTCSTGRARRARTNDEGASAPRQQLSHSALHPRGSDLPVAFPSRHRERVAPLANVPPRIRRLSSLRLGERARRARDLSALQDHRVRQPSAVYRLRSSRHGVPVRCMRRHNPVFVAMTSTLLARDAEVLAAIGRFRMLTRQQVKRWFFSDVSEPVVTRFLHRTNPSGYLGLQRLNGNGIQVVWLTRKGRDALVLRGVSGADLFPASGPAAAKDFEHTVAIGDVAVWLALRRPSPDELLPASALARHFGGRLSVIPDLLALWRPKDGVTPPAALAVEVDLGTEPLGSVLAPKLRELVRVLDTLVTGSVPNDSCPRPRHPPPRLLTEHSRRPGSADRSREHDGGVNSSVKSS